MILNKLLAFLFLLVIHVVSIANEIAGTFIVGNTLQSNMVVQQGKPLVVWGCAKPGMTITVKAGWQNERYNTVTLPDSIWKINVPVPMANPGVFSPHVLNISSGSETRSLFNILIGDVWLCSGQSNVDMELKPLLPWLLGTMHYRMEIENANFPQIRLFNVRTDFKSLPQEDCGGKWIVCSPSSAPDFSALAYFFAREIFRKKQIPVGLVVSSVGASSCEAWTGRDSLLDDPVLNQKYLAPFGTTLASKEILDSVVTFEKVLRPALLYNAMIHPLKNMHFSGALWYQGESNRHDSALYTRLCSSMIRNWRDLFDEKALPFYYVQVAPYFWQQNDTTLYEYALLREAQSNIRNVLDNTEMVVTMDIADPSDIHPRNKQEVGYRLAKIALSNVYKVPGVVFRGPEYKQHIIGDSTVKITFTNYGSGLMTNDGLAPKHFYIAGANGKFFYANARLEDNQVWLTSPEVKEPVHVRYAFTNYPVTNLENKEGFPAVPFRSDN